MKLYYSNNIQDAILTPSSEGTNQDVEYLKVPHLAQSFNFGATSGNLVIDLQGPVNIKSFIVDIGSLTGAGTYTLEGNASDVWTSPSYSQSLNISDTALYLDLDETYQYWRLVLVDTVELEIGYIMIGDEAITMPGIDPSVTLKYGTTAKYSLSVSGQVYGDDGWEFLETKFMFPKIDVETRLQLKDLWYEVKNINPIWVMVWESSLDSIPPVFSILKQKSMDFKKLKYGPQYSTKISIREVK